MECLRKNLTDGWNIVLINDVKNQGFIFDCKTIWRLNGERSVAKALSCPGFKNVLKRSH
jgi:hypothetical protein